MALSHEFNMYHYYPCIIYLRVFVSFKGDDNNTEEPEEDPEFWDDIPDEILSDIGKEQPLPEPNDRPSIAKKFTSLLQWFGLFVLLWHANCKISDNGMEWLLRFLFQFLHLLGVTCNCEYLIQFCAMFPTSLFVLRQLVIEMILSNMLFAQVAPPCMILETALSGSEVTLSPNAVHTKRSRKERVQRNVELSWQKKLCCQMEKHVFIQLKCIVSTV